jgi:hypothetical protein
MRCESEPVIAGMGQEAADGQIQYQGKIPFPERGNLSFVQQ